MLSVGAEAGAGAAARERAALSWLLARAARDGHTAARSAVLLNALAALDVADPAAALASAAAAGAVVAPADGEPAAGLVAAAELAAAEDAVAEQLERLLLTADPGSPAVIAVLGCCPAARRAAFPVSAVPAVSAGSAVPGELAVSASSAESAELVLEDAHRLDVPAAAERLEDVPDGAMLVLSGDLAALPGVGPGDLLADVVASGVVPVHQAPCPEQATATEAAEVATPAQFAHAIRAGRLPSVASPDRALVAVPAEDDAQCVRRVVQLVGTSIPRAFGLPASEVLVVTPLHRGVAGTLALTEALAEALAGAAAGQAGGVPQVRTVADAVGREADAVVAVLPAGAAGVLSRPLVHAAAGIARRHLSVVSAAGPALPRAVASVVRRPRTTRLAALLRAAASD